MKAGVLYEEILALTPSNAEILHLSGVVCIEAGDYGQAVERISRAMTRWPNQPVLMNSLGLALLGLERLDVAVERFKDAVRLKPDYAEAYCHLGRVLLHQKKEREAVAELHKAVRLAPKHPQANELLAAALHTLGMQLLAHYYQRLAWHYGDKFPDPATRPAQHTFFLDRVKARYTAHQGNRVKETMAITGLQMCYHLGDTFPDAPPNLVQVPLEQKAFVAFFLSSRLSAPVEVDFNPAVEDERILAHYIIKNLSDAQAAQLKAFHQLLEQCRATPPERLPGQPWRVGLSASRKTTVMQYNARDLAQGFRNLGCEVSFLIEANEMESLNQYHCLQVQSAFNPHIVLNINHLNNASLHPDVFNVTWWEDLMESLSSGKPMPWRERDLIYSISKELDTRLYQCAAPKVQRQGFCYDDQVFRDIGQERKRKVVVVASSYRNSLSEHAQTGELLVTLEAMFAAGEPMTHETLEQLAKNSEHTKDDIFWNMWHYVVRDQSVRWLCTLSDLIDVEVYGRYWEKDEQVRPFFKGLLPHGPAVATVYNEASYTLVPHPFDLQSQRLMEVAACGSIPIVYDCRYRAEQPHWDENCLWYRTKEEMRTCLTSQPPTPSHRLCQGRSYTDFARRILTEVESRSSLE